jgi:glycyl-tRNA synthetase (class II)
MIGGLERLAQEFAGHADRGTYTQVPHDQAYSAYQQLSQQMSPDQFAQAVQEYYQKASPEQRTELAQKFQSALGQTNDPQAQQLAQTAPKQMNPSQVAQMHQYAQQKQPDLIQKVFSPGGPLSSTTSKIAVAGIAALAAKHFLSH